MSAEADWPIVRVPRHMGPDGFRCPEQRGEVSIPGRQATCVCCHASITLFGSYATSSVRRCAAERLNIDAVDAEA